MSDDRSFDPRYDPAFQRGWDGPAAPVTSPAPRPAEPERIVVAPERVSADEGVDGDEALEASPPDEEEPLDDPLVESAFAAFLYESLR